MKLLFVLIIISLSGCVAKPNDRTAAEPNLTGPEPVNLIGDKEAVKRYWEISRVVSPDYPIEAARNGLSGCVEFTATIASHGEASNYRITRAC